MDGGKSSTLPDVVSSGVIVMPDETLRVCYAGQLAAVTVDGAMVWHLDFNRLISDEKRWISSLPTALQNGDTLLVFSGALLRIDRFGNIMQTMDFQLPSDEAEGAEMERLSPDDTRFSPNLMRQNSPSHFFQRSLRVLFFPSRSANVRVSHHA